MADYRIVPAVATEAMHQAWLTGTKNGGESLADTDWRVMLAAAPSPDYYGLVAKLHDAIGRRDGWARTWAMMPEHQRAAWCVSFAELFEGKP